MPRCDKCKWHDDCICVVCEEGETVVCMMKGQHMLKWEYCPSFELKI